MLRYQVAGKGIQDALLTHRSAKGGFFTLILQPPERVNTEDVTPKELVFVLDTSGSMSGFPIEKAKETMKLALDGLYPADTFNVITFSGDTRILFPEPVPASPENLKKAQSFLADTSGAGGTEMMKAIKASLDPSDSQKHVRIVCFMTDGYVGNDMEIIAEVQKHPNARVFAFGIGSSVNRFLLDKMAEQGRGEVEYVALNDDGSAAARRFHERVRKPLLTDIAIDWNGLPVADVYPTRIPDLFAAKPVVLSGRYGAAAQGVIRLRGKMAGQDFVREHAVDFPDSQTQHDVLSSLWARNRIDDLMNQDYNGAQRGSMRPDLKETITNLGLEYRLMTQFTSFVAVEEMIVTDGGKPRRIDVPVEIPEGVSREGVFGTEYGAAKRLLPASRGLFMNSVSVVSKSGANSTGPKQRAARRDKNVRASDRNTGGGGGGAAGGVSAGVVPNAPPAQSTVTLQEADAAMVISVSPEEQERQKLLTKLHPSILAVIERLKNKQTKPGADEAKFIRDG
ncbi:MAG: VWA domain-containing protein, partial [Pyrinomonadaceae bacterium]